MFDFLVALYHVAADYHSGQFSKGYRLGCLSSMYLDRWYDHFVTLDEELTPAQQKIYFALVERHQRWL
jgi:hypothetical protein